jgi:hypothetical protein
MKVSRELTVHMPQARMMVIKNKYQHVKDKPSAGFIGNIYLSPMTVSFAKIHWREAGGKAIARATANRNTPGGYFIFDEGKPHHASNLAPGGPDDANKMAVGKGNSSKGCKVLQHDRVWSGYNTSYPNPFTGKAANRRDYTDVVTTVPSEMIWKINWQYCPSDKVGFGGGRWITFQQVEHQATMDAKGKVTISKAGARKTFALADATMAFPAT